MRLEVRYNVYILESESRNLLYKTRFNSLPKCMYINKQIQDGVIFDMQNFQRFLLIMSLFSQ